MYVKKNLMLCLAVFALALPLLLAGTASAKYFSDGATPAPAGGFILPTDGICVLSLGTDGTMVTDPTITNKRDCDARLVDVTAVTPNDTLANVCGTPSKNVAGVKYANPGSNTCVTVDGSNYINGSISMRDRDRTTQICTALTGTIPATGAVKKTANGTAAKCIAYSWQYRGQDATGTPLLFGTKGTTQAAGTGYCYTSVNAAVSYGTGTVNCPNNKALVAPFDAQGAYDWSSPVAGNYCVYSKGIKGYISTAATKADGTTILPIGTYRDMSLYTTSGECLANGGSWANWIIQPSALTTLTSNSAGMPNDTVIPAWNYQKQAPDADDGCLHCHSFKAQQNGPAERYKETYLKTGHKNMLRKVITGQLLTGPDGVAYTTDGTNTINMAAGTVNVGGTDRQLFYVYGDWMAALPSLVYSMSSLSTNGYTCGACHTTGYQDASNPGVQSIGNTGYTAQEPEASFPGILLSVASAPKWDLEGITCARCHNASVGPINQTMINASSFKSTAPHGGGMGALAAGVGRNNLCFGCHQSMGKNWPAQGGAAGGTTQYDPTLIPTGVSHGAAAGRDFNGHVLGNSFLNSVHARYQGVNSTTVSGGTRTNALGKLDLVDAQPTSANVLLEYKSDFVGYTCWQSTSSSSPGMTKADGTEIETKAECEALYGAGAWRKDTGSSSAGAAGFQGTCTTCHDVHNSLFVASQSEKALRKTCEKCHVDNATTHATDDRLPQISVAVDPITHISAISHPTGSNTPFDTKYESSCVVCHMATQAQENGNQNSMPVHVWRINTSATYSTFPTADQFNGTNGATKDRNAQVATENYTRLDGTTGTYAKAVWVDVDLACGQCHGGTLGEGATANAAPYFTKTYLSQTAKNMHKNRPTASFSFIFTGSTVSFRATDSVCSGPCTYTWAFGDGGTATGYTTSHAYASAATVTATLTVNGAASDSISKRLTPPVVRPAAVSLAPGATVTPNGLNPSVNWTISNGAAPYMVRVNWGDGTVTPVTQPAAGPGTLAHTFVTARTYTVTVFVTDSGVAGSNQTTAKSVVSVPTAATLATVSGLVTSSTGTKLTGVQMVLRQASNNVAKYIVVTGTTPTGTYLFTGVTPTTYNLTATKTGYTFPAPVTVNVVGSTPVSVPTITAVAP